MSDKINLSNTDGFSFATHQNENGVVFLTYFVLQSGQATADVGKENALYDWSQFDTYNQSIYNYDENAWTFSVSVADIDGNVVSSTYTLNSTFGSGVVIKGTGILMNNEMDDFSAAPGIPNQFGLLGAKANEIEPQKRPLSSMTPTIIMKDGELFFTTGSPGGSRIISATSLPALIQGSSNSGGNTAKCAPLNGLVVTDQTDLLFFFG